MFGFYNFFHRLRKPGRISIFLVVLVATQYIFFNNSASYETEVQTLHLANKNSEYVGKLYLEYCIRRVVDRKKCLFSKPFFLLKRKKTEIENSKKKFQIILNDMGKRYKQSDHFLTFYRKLLFEDEDVKKLDSYPAFNMLKMDTHKKLGEIHKKHFKVSHYNKSFQSVLNSLVSAETFFQIMWITTILLLFGQGLEQVLGGKLYIGFLLVGSFAGIHAYLAGMTESTYIISGEFVILCLILGNLFGTGRGVGFYFTRRLRVSLRATVFILWILQECALHYFHPLTTAHLAHFFSFIFGISFGLVFHYKYDLPTGFLSPKVSEYWNNLKLHHNLEHMLNVGMHVLEANPDNFSVKQDMLITILDAQLKADNKIVYWNYLESILPDLAIVYGQQESKYNLILQMLRLLPRGVSAHLYLRKMKFSSYKVLIEMAKKQNELIVFIKLLESALIHHKKNAAKAYTKETLDLDSINLKTLDIEDTDKKDIYRKYVLNSQSLYLQELLMPFLRN